MVYNIFKKYPFFEAKLGLRVHYIKAEFGETRFSCQRKWTCAVEALQWT